MEKEIGKITLDTDESPKTDTTEDFEGKGIYKVQKEALMETDTHSLYVATLPSGQIGLMMIAKDASSNYLVQKQSHILATLQEMADYANEGVTIKPNYGVFFPKLVEFLMTEEDEPRAVLFMGYDPAISTYKQLIPLSVILKDQRVDLQTGVWLLGKYLKVLDFVHVSDFTVGFVDETNWLIEPDLHGIFILNWFEAIESNSTDENRCEDIKSATKIVWQAVGGTDTNDPPYDEAVLSKEGYAEFVAFLKKLISGDIKTADEERQFLYDMADRIWERVPDEGGYNPDGKKRPFHNWVVYSKPVVTE
jgi:hypothetical protein